MAQTVITATIDPDALIGAFDDFVSALDRNLPGALKLGSTLVSNHAKQNHPWTARSGFLDISIRPLDPEGSFSAGTLSVDILAGGLHNVDYALYVELGTKRSKPYPYMVPALDAKMPNVVKLIGDAIDLSVEEAGL